jgi:hypothetical protein
MPRYNVTVYREIRQAVIVTFEAQTRSDASSVAHAMAELTPEGKWATQNVLAGGIVSVTEVK